MKQTEIQRRPLADTVLASLEPEEKEYRETYGVDRLYLVVSVSGRKRRELRFKKPNGKWGWHGLGSYPHITAKRAREKAYAAQKLSADGVDPVAHKAAAKASKTAAQANTFKTAADLWLQKKTQDGRAEKTLKGMSGALTNEILPALGAKPLNTNSGAKPQIRRMSAGRKRWTQRYAASVWSRLGASQTVSEQIPPPRSRSAPDLRSEIIRTAGRRNHAPLRIR